MRVVVIGQTGVLGRRVVEHFETNGDPVWGISRAQQTFPIEDMSFDLAINCAGNSRKFRAATAPLEVTAQELSVVQLLQRVRFDRLIHVSSIDAHSNESPFTSTYGLIKSLMERMVTSLFPRVVIVRPSMILDREMRKNVIFDLMTTGRTWLSSTSQVNLVTAQEVARTIGDLEHFSLPAGEVVSVIAQNEITVAEAGSILRSRGICDQVTYGTQQEFYDLSALRKTDGCVARKRSEEYLNEWIQSMTEGLANEAS